MKLTFRIGTAVLIVVLSSVFLCYLYNFTEIKTQFLDKKISGSRPIHNHFAIISQNVNDKFWQSVNAGAQKAGQKYDAAVEFDGPVIQNEEEELKDINIAIAARVEGIAVYVTDKKKFTPLINKAIGKGIKVVTIESDDKSSSRKSFIGPNSLDIGAAQGALAAQAEDSSCNAAIILGGNFAQNKDSSDALLEGFQQAIKNHPEIKIGAVENSSSSYFGAEKIIRNILYRQPDINTVICTDANDTLEIVQVLIDLNKTGSIKVIGYSNSAQIRDYIKNNVIFGSVYEDPVNTGYQSIECLSKLVTDKTVSETINTGVYKITRNNLLNYHDGA